MCCPPEKHHDFFLRKGGGKHLNSTHLHGIMINYTIRFPIKQPVFHTKDPSFFVVVQMVLASRLKMYLTSGCPPIPVSVNKWRLIGSSTKNMIILVVTVNFVMKKSMNTKRLKKSPHCHLPFLFIYLRVVKICVFFEKPGEEELNAIVVPQLQLHGKHWRGTTLWTSSLRYDFYREKLGGWRNRPIREVNIAMAYWDHPRYRKLLGSSPIYPPLERPPSPTLEDPHYLRTRTIFDDPPSGGNTLFG